MHLGGQGVTKMEPMNIGGTVHNGDIAFSMVNALHSSAIIKDGVPITMGDPAGFVIKTPERHVYHAGDTEIFSDMALIQRIHKPTVGLIPVGDRFTMGPETRGAGVQRAVGSRGDRADPLGHVRSVARRSRALRLAGPARQGPAARARRADHALAGC